MKDAARATSILAPGAGLPPQAATPTAHQQAEVLTLKPGIWGMSRLEDAGLLGKAPLPEELRGALVITGDDEDEDGAAIEADEDGEGDEEYAGVELFEE